MSENCGQSRDGANTSIPNCCGNGLGIPRLAALVAVSNSGGGRLILRVRESLEPRANKNVALAVRFLVSRRSTPALAISLLEVPSFGSLAKIEGRIAEMGAAELPPRCESKIAVAVSPYATCSNPCTPFFPMIRFTAANKYRSKKMPKPARNAQSGDGL